MLRHSVQKEHVGGVICGMSYCTTNILKNVQNVIMYGLCGSLVVLIYDSVRL